MELVARIPARQRVGGENPRITSGCLPADGLAARDPNLLRGRFCIPSHSIRNIVVANKYIHSAEESMGVQRPHQSQQWGDAPRSAHGQAQARVDGTASDIPYLLQRQLRYFSDVCVRRSRGRA